MIGSTVLHYRILEKLGEGGMGVVYKAQDTRLDRLVALKFLPENLARSSTDSARFLQEAKAAAALNHPNICTIHGIDQDEGRQFIVMEFVEGQTLGEKMGSVSQKQALDIAIQVADGLAAAHEKGITHRDIKPENIMIRKDGIVQIMDFGLAKLRGVTNLTQQGSTVGTARYMSPEQVQGSDLDHRSDIFSLGVVLYELLTGQLPFKGAHETALLYEIVNVDVTPMASVSPAIDPELDRIVLECLAKDPDERFQSAKEVSKELRRVKRESGKSGATRLRAATPLVSGERAAERGGSTRRRAIPLLYAILLACGAAAITGVVAWNLRPAAPSVAGIRKLDLAIPNVDLRWYLGPELSPDGTRFAYSSNGSIWIRDLGDLEPRAVAEIVDPSPLFWSRDGAYVGYCSRGKVWKVSAAQGAPVAIADVPGAGSIVGGAWGSDNTIVIAVWRGGLYRVSANGGNPTLLLAPDPATQIDFHFPTILPDGSILFITHWGALEDSAGAQSDRLTLLDAAGSRKSTIDLSEVDSSPKYWDGHLLFVRTDPGAGIWAVPFDLSSGTRTATPFRVVANATSVSLANDGTLLYVESARMEATYEMGWVNRAGAWAGQTGTPRSGLGYPALSPDGRRVAYVAGTREDRDVWIYDLSRHTDMRITFEPGIHTRPRWVDSKRVIYGVVQGLNIISVIRNADGSGSPRILKSPEGAGFGTTRLDVTPDRKHYVQIFDDGSGRGELLMLPLQEDAGTQTAQRVFQEDPGPDVSDVRVSPDGRLLAYVTDVRSQPEVFLTRFPSGDGTWQVSTDGGRRPEWDPRGNMLYYVAGSGPSERTLVGVEVNVGDNIPVGVQTSLFNLRGWEGAEYQVEPGGARFLVVRRTIDESETSDRIVLVENWQKEFDALRSRQ